MITNTNTAGMSMPLDEIIRSLRNPDPEHQVRAGNALGDLARRGKAHEIAIAGGVRGLIDCFSSGGPEPKNSSAHALRDCAEGGEVQRVIQEGGFPILHGMVRYGKWNASSMVVESLSEMNHPEAFILIQEIVDTKAKALERDTFRDVYEMIKEPFPDSAVRRDDPDPILDGYETDGGVGIDPRKGGGGQAGKGSSDSRSLRDNLKVAFFPFFFFGSIINRLLSGKGKESVPGARVPVKEDIPRLIGKLDSTKDNNEAGLNDTLDRLLWFVRRGWGDLIVQGGGVEKILSIMDRPSDAASDRRKKAETLIIRIVKDMDEWDIEGTNIVEQLCTGLSSPEPHVRSFSLGMLRKLNRGSRGSDAVKKQGIRDILRMLDDEDPDIRLQTIGILGELGSSRAIKPLREMIEDEGGNERDNEASRAAQIALERLS